MPVRIRPLDPGLFERAACLLAERHRAARAAWPQLPAEFDAPAAHLAGLAEEVAGSGAGAVALAALDDQGLAGFAVARMPLPAPQSFLGIYLPSHHARLAHAGWGLRAGAEHETVRALYAAMAPALVARGAFSHFVYAGAHETTVQRAWRSLGFGRTLAIGLRDTSDVQTRPLQGVTVRRATLADLETCVRMVSDNDRHHATSPIFAPYMPETPEVHRTVLGKLLADSACSAWLAEDDAGRCLGIVSFSVAGADMQTPAQCVYLEDGYTTPDARGLGVGTALLAAGLAWARGEGRGWCAISWNTENLLGARFWQSHGFRPLVYRLRRQIDPRVAWARPGP